MLAKFMPGPLAAAVAVPLERLLVLDGVAGAYNRVRTAATPLEFARSALDALGVAFELRGAFGHTPRSGPLVVVANHPLGGLEGLFLYAMLAERRPDVRMLANRLLQRLAPLAPAIIAVDVLGGHQARAQNATALRLAAQWVAAGGALLVFPAGEVSALRIRDRAISDPPWRRGVARIIRTAEAPVVPIHVDCNNGALFHAAGVVHARLRTALLPRELLNKRGRVIPVTVGPPIEAARLATLDGDAALIDYLRLRVYGLGVAPFAEARAPAADRPPELVAGAGHCTLLADEVSALDRSQRLATNGDLEVWHANSAQVPKLLEEIGRLRELTFRSVGEGTGRSRDIDHYDAYYRQLFLWNRRTLEVVGGYRIGEVDTIRARFGTAGLYTSTLFEYRESLLAAMGPALELGRSFVRPEYQRKFSPLLLLWKGIAAYVAKHPRYHVLIGPASISNDYSPASQALLTGFLAAHGRGSLTTSGARGRNPVPRAWRASGIAREAGAPTSIESVDAKVSALEMDGKGVPVLIRQYLRLGARVLGFNVDAAFGHSIDVLVAVDLCRTDPRMLTKFMGTDAALQYLASADRRDPGADPTIARLRALRARCRDRIAAGFSLLPHLRDGGQHSTVR